MYLTVDEMVYNLGGLFQFHFFPQKLSTHLKMSNIISVKKHFSYIKNIQR